MPNHVRNIVKMKGITTLRLFTEAVTSSRNEWAFDFNKIIPMPGSLKLKAGSIEDLAIETALRSDAVLRYEFEKIKPSPQIKERDYHMLLADCELTPASLCKLGMQYINNLKLYGATTWYDWCTENWGTKWNSYDNKQIDVDTIRFSTAWNSPEKVIAQLAKMYPNAEIEHWWADEDMGYNTGYAKYSAGKEESSTCHDACSHTAYETYILCWGESKCLYQDVNGLWQHRNCDECHGCD